MGRGEKLIEIITIGGAGAQISLGLTLNQLAALFMHHRVLHMLRAAYW